MRTFHRNTAAGMVLFSLLTFLPAVPPESIDSPGAAAHAARRSKKKSRKRKLVKKLTATAYCLGPCRRCETRGRTFTGKRGRKGVAVSRPGRRQAFPIGAEVYVPGYGWSRVDDVGGKVGARQIDLRFPRHSTAKRWGKQSVRVVAWIDTA